MEAIYIGVDIGSNSFRLLVTQCIRDNLCILHEDRVRVQLAKGLDENDYLSEEAITRAVDALETFQKKINQYENYQLKVVATNTLRVAKNASAFLQIASTVFDKPIDIISGVDEAKYIYKGVTRHLGIQDRTHFVIDIGGGSTELIVGVDQEPKLLDSLPMGCISFQREFFDNKLILSSQFEQAHEKAKTLLAPVVSKFKELPFNEVHGCSGTVGAIWNALNHYGFQDNVITRESIEEIMREIVRLGCYDQLARLGISKDRVHIFPGGLAILHAVITLFDITELHVSTAALRDGLIYDMVDKT